MEIQKHPQTRAHNMGRPVLIRRVDKETGDPVDHAGVFQVWGYRRLGGKDGPPTMETVAVVELVDGRIATVLPQHIQFLEEATHVRK